MRRRWGPYPIRGPYPWAFAVTFALALGACLPSAPAPVSPTPTASVAVVAPATEFDAAKAKAHVDYLADAARGGRYSGSAGYRDAATYVADRFREIGLEPLGDNGTFFQHFTMPIVELTEMSTLTGPGGKTYRPRVDFTESVGGRSGSGKVEAEISAVGGAARSGGLNDFAGANVRGKIALVTGPGAPNGGSSVENAYQEGAIGVLIVGGATLRYSYIPRLQTVTVPTLVISQEVADQLLASAGRTVSSAQDLVRARRADPNAPASGFDVPTTVAMTVSLTPVHDVDAFNVVGLLRSPDPNNTQRAVLVGGHLDGVGTDPDGSVFQAANDNASGPAVTIEVARALAASRASLSHSVVFVAFAGEEEGFFGSEAYVTQMAVAPGRVESLVAVLNLDVIGCCSQKLLVSNEAPDLQRRVRDTATRLGVASDSTGSGGSDQASFARRRVPAVFIGAADFILHVYADKPAVVEASWLKKAGDVVTAVTKDLASAP
ncbi:MAG TPA: M28 family peptidase [Methylomirabilota bacterium]|nr:M28 family peptidase [Methylomirabilota bacterium]